MSEVAETGQIAHLGKLGVGGGREFAVIDKARTMWKKVMSKCMERGTPKVDRATYKNYARPAIYYVG